MPLFAVVGFTISQVNVADHSGSHWLTCFQDTATEVLGTDAEQLGILRDSDEAAFDEVFQRANFKDFTFKVRAKMDMFNVSIGRFPDILLSGRKIV